MHVCICVWVYAWAELFFHIKADRIIGRMFWFQDIGTNRGAKCAKMSHETDIENCSCAFFSHITLTSSNSSLSFPSYHRWLFFAFFFFLLLIDMRSFFYSCSTIFIFSVTYNSPRHTGKEECLRSSWKEHFHFSTIFFSLCLTFYSLNRRACEYSLHSLSLKRHPFRWDQLAFSLSYLSLSVRIGLLCFLAYLCCACVFVNRIHYTQWKIERVVYRRTDERKCRVIFFLFIARKTSGNCAVRQTHPLIN